MLVSFRKASSMLVPCLTEVLMQSILFYLANLLTSQSETRCSRSLLFPIKIVVACQAFFLISGSHQDFTFSKDVGSLRSKTSSTPWQPLKQVETMLRYLYWPAVSQINNLIVSTYSGTLTSLSLKSITVTLLRFWSQSSPQVNRINKLLLPTEVSPTKMILYLSSSVVEEKDYLTLNLCICIFWEKVVFIGSKFWSFLYQSLHFGIKMLIVFYLINNQGRILAGEFMKAISKFTLWIKIQNRALLQIINHFFLNIKNYISKLLESNQTPYNNQMNNSHQNNNQQPNQDITEERNYLRIGGQDAHQHDGQQQQQNGSRSRSPSSHSSESSSSEQSKDQKWQYESIKEGDQNAMEIQGKESLLGENHPQKQGEQDNTGRIVRYKYCCKKCKHADRDKEKKACVCVVPRDQRRTHLGNEGCQTCGCNGCSKEDFLFRGEDPEYHPEEKKKDSKKKEEKFEARNGCCKGCMKAFSKSGKSCICQVPEDVRKTKLATGGCKICGCVGCNPEDKKTSQRQEKKLKRSRSRSERRKQKRERRSRSKEKKRRSRSRSPQIIDTFAMNFHNVDRSIVGSMIINEYQLDPALLGFGVPQRSSSYLFGRN